MRLPRTATSQCRRSTATRCPGGTARAAGGGGPGAGISGGQTAVGRLGGHLLRGRRPRAERRDGSPDSRHADHTAHHPWPPRRGEVMSPPARSRSPAPQVRRPNHSWGCGASCCPGTGWCPGGSGRQELFLAVSLDTARLDHRWSSERLGDRVGDDVGVGQPLLVRAGPDQHLEASGHSCRDRPARPRWGTGPGAWACHASDHGPESHRLRGLWPRVGVATYGADVTSTTRYADAFSVDRGPSGCWR